MAIATTAQLTQVSSLYVALFNRAPDTVGLSFWGNAYANGASLDIIAQGFLNAPEGILNYPAFQTSSEFVTSFYTKVFGRAPDAGGLSFWTTALNNAGGAESNAAKAAVVSQIISTVNTPLTSRPAGITDAEYAQTLNDRALFANKVDVGTYLATQSPLTVTDATAALTGVTSDPATVVTAKSALFATAITNALVAPGALVLGSTGSDIFNLTDVQLNTAPAGFALDGNTGVDTLVLTTTGGPSITDATKNVSNVEVINVSGAGGTTTTLAAGRFAGATTFGSTGSGSLTVTGLSAGQSVAILKTGDTAATYLAAATTASLNISGGTSGTVAINGAGLTSLAVTSNGATPNETGTMTLAATIGALSIDATAGLKTTIAGGKAGTALTITGGGAVTLNTVPNTITSINAGGASGGLTATVGAAITTLTGSSGADNIAVAGALAAGASVSLGDGNDTLTGSGGSVTTGANIDGGAGTDTVSTALINAGNAASFKNFEQIQVEGNTIVDSSLLTGSTLTGITIANSTGGGAVNNVSPSVGLTATGTATGTTTISVTGALANTADTYTVTLANTTANTVAAAGTIGLANIETVNVVSGGTASAGNNTIEIADAALKTLNVTGDKAVSITFSTTTTGTSLIDASAATGAVTLDTTNLVAAAGGLTVKGGTGADQLTVTQAATVTSGGGNDTIFAGANTITVGTPGAATSAELTSKLLTVTDFARSDTVDLSVGGLPGTPVSIDAVTDLSAEADLVAAATIAANTTATAAAGGVEVSAFRFGGDTYLLLDAAGAGTGGVATNDVLVKLSGVIDLSTATVDLGTGAVLYV